ncbi:MAG: hypothetical protein RLZZ210_731 [Pseudomonadota bacterium]|jgi:predicted nucleic acid-binding protein
MIIPNINPIVVDTNIIAYLYLQNNYTKLAENLLIKNAEWHVPILWKSEIRSVLIKYLRGNFLSFEEVINIQKDAEKLVFGKEYEVDSYSVLELVKNSTCSSYDCEFIALAKNLNTKLITMDKKLLSEFRNFAVSLEEFLQS